MDYSRSKHDRALQDDIGMPSMSEFIKMVENDLMINCPVIKNYINISGEICVTNLSSLKGKTMRKKPIQVCDSILTIPISIYNKYKHITLCADVMKVNTIHFFLYISKRQYFFTFEFIEEQKADHFMMAMNNMNTLYLYCGFQITQAKMDG